MRSIYLLHFNVLWRPNVSGYLLHSSNWWTEQPILVDGTFCKHVYYRLFGHKTVLCHVVLACHFCILLCDGFILSSNCEAVLLAVAVVFLNYCKNATRGIEKLMNDTASRSSSDGVHTQNHSKRKMSQLTSVKHEYVAVFLLFVFL